MSPKKNSFFGLAKKERIDFIIALIVISLFGYFILSQSISTSVRTEDNIAEAKLLDQVNEVSQNSYIESTTKVIYKVKEDQDKRLKDQRVIDETIDSIPFRYINTSPITTNKASIKEDRVVIEINTKEPIKEEVSIDQEEIDVATQINPTLAIEDSIVEQKNIIDEEIESPVIDDSQRLSGTVNDDCIIIIGAFSKSSNITKLLKRLDRDGYNSFTTPFRGLTRVGIYLTCEEDLSKSILSEVRSRYAQDAVLLVKE